MLLSRLTGKFKRCSVFDVHAVVKGDRTELKWLAVKQKYTYTDETEK